MDRQELATLLRHVSEYKIHTALSDEDRLVLIYMLLAYRRFLPALRDSMVHSLLAMPQQSGGNTCKELKRSCKRGAYRTWRRRC
jgi:hypothetical protein